MSTRARLVRAIPGIPLALLLLVTYSPRTAIAAVGASSPVMFGTPIELRGAARWSDVAVADVTGDGRDDVVALGDGTVYVFRQRSAGTLADPAKYPLAGAMDSLATGDLNGDGAIDVIAGSQAGVLVLLQSGGTLVGPTAYPSPRQVTSVAAGDVNDDGLTDVVMLEYGANQVVIRRIQKADGSLGERVRVGSFHYQTRGVVVGDADGDTRDDILPVSSADPLPVYLQQADRSFARTDVAFGAFSDDVAVGDVTGDGRPDVVASSFGAILVRASRSPGTWDPVVEHSGLSTGSIAIADFDGNGGNYVAAWDSQGLGVFTQEPDAALEPSCVHRQDSESGSGDVGDLNGDGRPDVVRGYNRLLVHYQLGVGEQLSAQLSLATPSASLHAGENVTVSGVLSAAEPGCWPTSNVKILVAPPGGGFETVGEATIPLGADYFFFGLRPDRAGDWRAKARWRGGELYGQVESPEVDIHVAPGLTGIDLDADDYLLSQGETMTLRAYLGSSIPLPPGQPVEFFSTVGGLQQKIGTIPTDSRNVATLTVHPQYTAKYSARFAGTQDLEPSVSNLTEVEVEAFVTGRMLRPQRRERNVAIYRSDRRVWFKAAVDPNKAGQRTRVTMWASVHGRWREVFEQAFTLSSDSTATIVFPGRAFDPDRRYRIQASWASDRFNAGNRSRMTYFEVR